MKHTNRHMVALFLALIMMFSSCAVVFAEETALEVPTNCEVGLTAYAKSMAESYLRINNQYGDYSISQGIPVWNDQGLSKYIFFVFSGNKSVGYLSVADEDGTYYSSYVSENFHEIDLALNAGTPVAIINYQEACYLYCAGKYVLISGIVKGNITTELGNSISDANLCYETLSLSSINVTAITRGSTYEKLLEVPIVSNSTSPDTGEGLCWAACISSIGAYKTGTSPVYARTVYAYAKDNVEVNHSNGTPYEYPVGIVEFVQPTLLEMYGVLYYQYGAYISANSILNILDRDIPIYMAISRSAGWHAIVLCGIIIDGSSCHFIVMDPNVPSGHVTIFVPNPTTGFTYATSYGYTYTAWEYRLN